MSVDAAARCLLRRNMEGLAWLLTATALVHPIAYLLARWVAWADLLTHFQLPALVASLAAAACWAPLRPRLMVPLLALAAYQGAELVRYLGPNPVPAAMDTNERLRVLMANVLWDNSRSEPLFDLIRRERPDIIGLVEISDSWDRAIRDLGEDYPYGLVWPNNGAGLALRFRERPESIEGPIYPLPGANPLMHATFRFGGRVCHLWLIHPSSPAHSRGRRPGNPELAAIAGLVAASGGPAVVIGDFNTTTGSPHLASFATRSGLRDSRLGFGLQPTWPTWSLYRIAIDHALVSPELAVTDCRLGPSIGSDHFPLLLELAPAARAVTESASAGQSWP